MLPFQSETRLLDIYGHKIRPYRKAAGLKTEKGKDMTILVLALAAIIYFPIGLILALAKRYM